MTNLAKTIPENVVRSVLENAAGKFITINAIKKCGESTVINGQMTDSPPSHADKSDLICVKKGGKDNGYRTASVKRVTSLAFGGFIIQAK